MKFSCFVNDGRHSDSLVFIDCDFIRQLADLSGILCELNVCTAWMRYGYNDTLQLRNEIKSPLLGKLNCGRVKWKMKIYLLLTLGMIYWEQQHTFVKMWKILYINPYPANVENMVSF